MAVGERSIAALSTIGSEIWNSMLAGFDRDEVGALIRLLGTFIRRRSIQFAIEQPNDVDVNEIVVRPVATQV
jgi:hypothetical protein